MRRTIAAASIFAVTLVSLTISAQQRTAPAPAAQGARPQSSATYFPDRFEWQHKRPEEVGMNAALVAEAVKAAVSQRDHRQPRSGHRCTRRPSAGTSRSTPSSVRSSRADRPSGLIVHNGYIVAEWGEPEPRRHDQQRHEDVSHDGRSAWPGSAG